MNNNRNNSLQADVKNPVASGKKLEHLFNMRFLRKKRDWVLAEDSPQSCDLNAGRRATQEVQSSSAESENWDLPEYNNPYPLNPANKIISSAKTVTPIAVNELSTHYDSDNYVEECWENPHLGKWGQLDDSHFSDDVEDMNRTKEALCFSKNDIYDNNNTKSTVKKKTVTFDFSAECSIGGIEKDVSSKITLSNIIQNIAVHESKFSEQNIDFPNQIYNNINANVTDDGIQTIPLFSEYVDQNLNDLLMKLKIYLGDFCIVASTDSINQHIKHPSLYRVSDIEEYRDQMSQCSTITKRGQNNRFNNNRYMQNFNIMAAVSNNVDFDMNIPDMESGNNFI